MEKIYPQTVVVRKSLLTIAISAVVLVVGFIIYNLIHYSQIPAAMKTHQNLTINTLASEEDQLWIAKQKIHQIKPNLPLQTKTPLLKTLLNSSHGKTERMSNADIKAMTTPISANQLVQSLNHSPVNKESTEETNHSSTDRQALLLEKNSTGEYLTNSVRRPIGNYELKAGTMIPAILITGINSDLPGQIIAQVRSPIYDTVSGNQVLIPQGAKLIGYYDSQISYGQKRVLIVWNRIIFSNGNSLNLQGMPGIDLSGYAGFKDKVDNHYKQIFGSALLMSIVGAGAQLSQPQTNNNPLLAPTIGQTMAQSLATNLIDTAAKVTNKNLNIQPTLEIRPGYLFNVSVTKDISFPKDSAMSLT